MKVEEIKKKMAEIENQQQMLAHLIGAGEEAKEKYKELDKEYYQLINQLGKSRE